MPKHPKICVCGDTARNHHPACTKCPCTGFEPRNQVKDLSDAFEEELGITDEDYFDA